MKRTSLSSLPLQAVSHNPEIAKQVMLARGDLPHLTAFAQAQFKPGQVAAAHAHADMAEVFFVQSGQGQIQVETDIYELTPGTCIAVEPGETHEITNTGHEDLVLTYFGIQI